MKRIYLSLISILIFLLACGPGTFAQEEGQGQLWFCWEATVNPAQLDEFMDLQIDIRKTHLKEGGLSYPINAWTDGLFTYYFFYPVDSYDDKNKIYSELRKGIELYGNDWINRMFSTLDNHTTWFIRWDPELSYHPENPRRRSGDGVFCIWDIYYIDSGKEMEFRNLLSKIMTVLKEKGYDDSVDTHIGELGTDGYFYLGAIFGSSPADLWAQNEVMMQLMGEDGGKLFNEMRKYTKKRDFKQFWYVKELSYDPEE